MTESNDGKRRFSLSWAIGIFLLHMALSVIVGLLVFVSGMASFTTGTGVFHTLLKALFFLISPPLMMNQSGNVSDSMQLLAALGWSLMLAVIAGFVRAHWRCSARGDEAKSGQTTNPDLVGTPWADDPEYTSRDEN